MRWLKRWIIRREVEGAVRDAEKGKKGPMAKGAIEGFKASPGWRSAVMLLLLVVEGAFRQLGFDTGPMFFLLRTGFGAIGVNPDEAQALGIDPAGITVALVSLWVAVRRLWTVYRERRAMKMIAEGADVVVVTPAEPELKEGK